MVHRKLISGDGELCLLWAKPECQQVLPTTISHFYADGFTQAFDWTGTQDFSSYLAVREALYFTRYIDAKRIRSRNRGLCRWLELLASAWNTPVPSPMRMRGCMADGTPIHLGSEVAKAFPMRCGRNTRLKYLCFRLKPSAGCVSLHTFTMTLTNTTPACRAAGGPIIR